MIRCPAPFRFAVALIACLFIVTPLSGQAPERPTNRVGLIYENSSFTGAGGLSPWHELSLQLTRRTDHGSILGRVNLADRFGRRAAQFELDAYPSLGQGRYAFLNVGFAGDELYPTFRGSLEVWQGLPGPFEGSLGFRYMKFSRDVFLYTGSLAWYTGNYWISARPWVRTRDGEFSVSTYLNVRKYGVDRDDYIGALVGLGSGIGDLDTRDELDRLRSYRVGVETRKPLSESWFLKASASVDWEEIVRDRSRTRYKFRIGLERGF